MLGVLRFVASCDLVSIALAEIEWQTHRHSWISSALFEMEHRLPLKLIVLTGFRGPPLDPLELVFLQALREQQ
jgi:hypothetical protein